MSKMTQFRTFHNVSFEQDGDLNSPIIRQIYMYYDLKVTALELELWLSIVEPISTITADSVITMVINVLIQISLLEE